VVIAGVVHFLDAPREAAPAAPVAATPATGDSDDAIPF
jgi:hypothetical protein